MVDAPPLLWGPPPPPRAGVSPQGGTVATFKATTCHVGAPRTLVSSVVLAEDDPRSLLQPVCEWSGVLHAALERLAELACEQPVREARCAVLVAGACANSVYKGGDGAGFGCCQPSDGGSGGGDGGGGAAAAACNGACQPCDGKCDEAGSGGGGGGGGGGGSGGGDISLEEAALLRDLRRPFPDPKYDAPAGERLSRLADYQRGVDERAELGALALQLAPLLDRFGRVLSDLAPLVEKLGNSPNFNPARVLVRREGAAARGSAAATATAVAAAARSGVEDVDDDEEEGGDDDEGASLGCNSMPALRMCLPMEELGDAYANRLLPPPSDGGGGSGAGAMPAPPPSELVAQAMAVSVDGREGLAAPAEAAATAAPAPAADGGGDALEPAGDSDDDGDFAQLRDNEAPAADAAPPLVHEEPPPLELAVPPLVHEEPPPLELAVRGAPPPGAPRPLPLFENTAAADASTPFYRHRSFHPDGGGGGGAPAPPLPARCGLRFATSSTRFREALASNFGALVRVPPTTAPHWTLLRAPGWSIPTQDGSVSLLRLRYASSSAAGLSAAAAAVVAGGSGGAGGGAGAGGTAGLTLLQLFSSLARLSAGGEGGGAGAGAGAGGAQPWGLSDLGLGAGGGGAGGPLSALIGGWLAVGAGGAGAGEDADPVLGEADPGGSLNGGGGGGGGEGDAAAADPNAGGSISDAEEADAGAEEDGGVGSGGGGGGEAALVWEEWQEDLGGSARSRADSKGSEGVGWGDDDAEP